MMQGFTGGTHLTGSDEGSCVGIHGGPPQLMLGELEGPVIPGVASYARAVPPLKNLRPYRFWDEEPVRWAVTWVWLSALSLSDDLNLPGDRPRNTGGRHDGVRARGGFHDRTVWIRHLA